MMNFFLFLGIGFLFTFVVGRTLERIKVPWIFAALLFGVLLSVYNPFASSLKSSAFKMLADLGMYFLLFIIGLEIDLNEFKKTGKFIIESTIVITLLGALGGAVVIRLFFGYDWLLSAILGLSFATVGEAILIPILDEFRIVNTRLGQTIIGVGVLDDAFELLALVLAVALMGVSASGGMNFTVVGVSLLALLAMTFSLTKLGEEGRKIRIFKVETLFFLVIAIFFVFLGVGWYADSAAIAALLAGVAIKAFIPRKRLDLIETEMKAVCYGLFAPMFFMYVGASMDMTYLAKYPLTIIAIVAASGLSKLLGSYIVGIKRMGFKDATLLGIGLSVRFSTSIVIITILYNSRIISSEVFSVIVASSIIFTIFIPVLFAQLLARWKKESV